MQSLQDSLKSSTHKGITGWLMHPWETLLLWTSKVKKCCLYKTPYVAAPIRVPRWGHCKFYTLCTTSYICTYKSQNFFFWFTSDTFRKRPALSFQDSYMDFYEEVYKQGWYRKRTTHRASWGVPRRVHQASLQADSALTHCQEQKPQEPTSTRWLQEKGHWAISPDSCASHPLHF